MRNTILIIDDEELIRRSIKRLLGRAGFEVREAATLEDAWAEVAARPELLAVTLDLQLGNSDIRALLPDTLRRLAVPVIIVSGSLRLGESNSLVALGAFAVIEKEEMSKELVPTLRRLAEHG